jgi:hypothetical protein
LPEQWEEWIILPIFRKGGNIDCGNYRGV